MSYITEVDILDESKECFLTYASEVLTDRAIPAAEDGLLSAQRKILWTMEDYLKMNSSGKTKKCNGIIGSTLATSYFHGDQACYGVLTKMAQDYLMRYPLLIGQGSLGTQENNDMVASSRYCVTGDTLIKTTNGTFEIKDLVKNSEESSEHDININIIGYNGNIFHASKFFNSGKYPVKKLTLKNGMNISATDNHPLMTLDNELNFAWKLVENLKPGDKVLIPIFNMDSKEGREDYLEAAMLGTMISEGYATTQNRIGINNQDIEMIEPFFEYINREIPDSSANIIENKKRGYYEYCIADQYFYPQFIKEFEFEKSDKKHLPKQYFLGNKKYKATCLSYLFEGDGSVDLDHGISYSSISEKLIHQLQVSLIQDFGIVSSITRTKTRNEIKLRINNVSAERFLNEINFVSDRKKENLLKLVEKFNSSPIVANGNICNIYEVTEYIRNKYHNCFATHNGFSNIKNYVKAKNIVTEEEYNKIENIIKNYIYLEISDTEDAGMQTVYSIRVDDDSHSFIANGFINHNTEAKPSIYADLMMEDFKKNVVPLKETYNGEFMEPVVLPSPFPNALCNGRQAIGISMAHNSAPHNLSEVCEAIKLYINNHDITVDDIMTVMPGPDFPLPNIVINKNDIRSAFATGKSATSLKIRGIYEMEGNNIVFTSIPYRTYRNKIKEQIAKNIEVFDKLIDDFDDESNIGNNRLVFKVKKDVSPAKVLDKLFSLTDLQTTLSYNMNFIVNGTPKLCSIKDLIIAHYEHQTSVILNATKFDLDKAEKRKHILDGLLIIIKDIDKAIRIIRNSNDKTEAKTELIKEYKIDDGQAEAVLDMKLVRLTKLNQDDLLKELEDKIAIITECNKIINDNNYRDSKLIEKIDFIKNKYGDARRTQLLQIEVPKEDKEIVNVEPEKCVVVMTENGLIKRIPATSFRTQKRNGKGVKTQEDITSTIIRTNTIDSLMVFTDKGKMYRILVDNLPIGTNTSKGVSIQTLIAMEQGEKPTLIYSIYKDTDAKHILFVTKNGMVKKTALDDYIKTKKKSGVAAIKLRDGDSLASVSLIKDEDIILLTSSGYGIRFSSNEVPISSRDTIGVKGVELKENEEVIGMLTIRNATDSLALFAKNGLGKKINLTELPKQKRAGKGLILYKDEKLAAAALVEDEDTVLIVGGANGICISAKDIPLLSRTSVGNQLIKGTIVSVSKV